MQVTCQHCSYLWESKSKNRFVSCPHCMHKTKVEVKVKQDYKSEKEVIENGTNRIEPIRNGFKPLQFGNG